MWKMTEKKMSTNGRIMKRIARENCNVTVFVIEDSSSIGGALKSWFN